MSRHFVTDIDLEIIKNLYNLKSNQTITTYSLAKKMFSNLYPLAKEIYGNKNVDRKYLNNKTKYIDYRMSILNKLGIIEISNLNGRKVYTLILNNVYFKRIKYKRLGIDEEAMFIRDGEAWDIYFYKRL